MADERVVQNEQQGVNSLLVLVQSSDGWLKNFLGGFNKVIKSLCCAGSQTANDCLVQQCAMYKEHKCYDNISSLYIQRSQQIHETSWEDNYLTMVGATMVGATNTSQVCNVSTHLTHLLFIVQYM